MDPLPGNGGPTETRAFLAGNPAIDAGCRASPGREAAGACEPTDRSGVPRPRDGDRDGKARWDIGAYERQ